MSDRCEPPEHLRGVDGWHWLELHGMTQPAPYRWQNEGIWCGLERDGGAVRPLWAAKLGYRYHAPAASPEIVRGLVEALEGMQAAVKSLPPSAALRLSDDLVTRFLRVDGRATAMLKAAKEAGL